MVHTLIKLLSIKLSNINHAREKIIISINVINKLKFFHHTKYPSQDYKCL